MFPATVDGPFDDCYDSFPVRYYTVQWHVYDEVTASNLNQLSVNCSSGWQEDNVSSPIIHKYPYGTYDTVWTRQNFNSEVVFKCLDDIKC